MFCIVKLEKGFSPFKRVVLLQVNLRAFILRYLCSMLPIHAAWIEISSLIFVAGHVFLVNLWCLPKTDLFCI